MEEVVKCPACGEATGIPRCVSCGAELRIDETDDCVADDLDQAARDRDQTAGDQDQTWSDHDQTASERDQRSADEDQQAADDDLAAGGDATTHHRSALARERSGQDRDAVSNLRAESAAARTQTAADRDRAAELRDRGAKGRDALARLHDLEDDADASREDILLRAERDRARAAADRAKAADDRARAAYDRQHAARERAKSANNLKLATTDELTGAWTRKFGLEEVSRELERAHRTGATLVLGFVDVDGLKTVNDAKGHLAGDALLRLLGELLRANVRRYDVIVRFGGDELLCAMPNINAHEARARFEKIAAALAAVDADHSITFGLAEAEPTDSLEDLIARADADLIDVPHSGTS
jgi:diguanylate cyclase (GGDEF)-like protein